MPTLRPSEITSIFKPLALQILQGHLFPHAVYTRSRADRMEFDADGKKIIARLRGYDHWQKTEFRGQFTFRTGGGDNELHKIIDLRDGDYLLYGFRNSNDTKIHAWAIGNLDVFRAWHEQQHGLPGTEWPNFRAFAWKKMPQGFLVACDVRLRKYAEKFVDRNDLFNRMGT